MVGGVGRGEDLFRQGPRIWREKKNPDEMGNKNNKNNNNKIGGGGGQVLLQDVW